MIVYNRVSVSGYEGGGGAIRLNIIHTAQSDKTLSSIRVAYDYVY